MMNEFLIADMHCDTLSASLAGSPSGREADLRTQDTQVNFEKMKQSGYLLQNFAAFVDLDNAENPLEEALRMADLFYRQLDAHSDLIAPAVS